MGKRSESSKTHDFETDVFRAELNEIAQRRIEVERRRRRLALEQTLKAEGVVDPGEIERRRELLELELAALRDPFEHCEPTPSLQLGLVGLAISGGGIRSATSALGVIQTLASKNLLEEVDYLSTVSGGGFIGSCLSSVLNDPETGTTPKTFPLSSDPGRKEHPALGHLRNASRYLAPGGLLDTLRIPALLLRGMLNNFAIFLFLIMLLVMVTEVGYQLAWRYEFDVGDTLLVMFLGFLLLPMLFPLAARFGGGLSWNKRNLSGRLFSWWLLILLAALAMIPLAILVDGATNVNLEEARAILLEEMRRPFELEDIYKWAVLVAVIGLFLSAAKASQTVARLRSKLVIFAVGLLGPAILLAMYLAIIVSELESGFIATKPLFRLNHADVGYMAGAEHELRPLLEKQFAKKGIVLPHSYSLVPMGERRWVITHGEHAYGLTLDGHELRVEHELVYPLERARVQVPPALRDALSVKGYVLPAHAEVLRDTVDADPRPRTAYDVFYLRGRRELAVLPEHSQLSMVVHSHLATAALHRASSMFNRFISWPLPTPLHQDARLADHDLDAALRFVEEGRHQDIVLVVDETAGGRDLHASIMAAIGTVTRTKGMQVAVFHRQGTDLTFYPYQALADVVPGVRRGEKRDLKECHPSAPAGPAVLLCAMAHASAPWRHDAERSVWFVGAGEAQFDAGAYAGWAAKVRDRRDVRVFALDVRPGVSPQCDAATQAQPCNFLKAFEDYEPTFAEVPEGTVSAELKSAATKRLAAYASHSPRHESMRVADRRSTLRSYTLIREGSLVRIEAQVPLPALPSLKQGDRLPAELVSFLADGGIFLSPLAFVTKSASLSPSYPEEPCMDAQSLGWRSGCMQVNDPYVLELKRVHGGLKVRQVQERPWWDAWIPGSVAWEGTPQWPWITVLALLLGYWFYFNVNMTSLNRFYRDRLSSAYLFGIERATGDRKKAALFPNDTQKLSGLNRDGSVAPYHLINVALNLADSRAEDLLGRGADFFVLSKHFTGSPRVGFVPTRMMERCDHHLDLGTAMAISGAAAAPNMGNATQQLLVFILTLLNIRLGYWLPNPRVVGQPRALQRFIWRLGPGPTYLLREAMGWVHERSDYVNVTDGGHIENLGVYELLRRRCKCIIAIDGEADPELRFSSLMKVIRYARIDFGIKIDFDLQPMLDDIRMSGEGGLSRHCWAVAKIDYGGDGIGRLYYVKSAVTGSEPDYVKDYRQRFPAFPHESTSQQFFTETQFEAYRALGEHIGKSLSEDVIRAFIKERRLRKVPVTFGERRRDDSHSAVP